MALTSKWRQHIEAWQNGGCRKWIIALSSRSITEPSLPGWATSANYQSSIRRS